MDEDCRLFTEQIQADLGYFQHGTALLEKAMTAIQGRVEIEQAESDRSLENTIQVVGVGLGTGAIVSGVVSQYIKDPFSVPYLKHQVPPMLLSFFWSLVATLLSGWLALRWTQRSQRKK